MSFLRFLGFTLVRAGQGFWRNRMMSLAATATVILMLVLLSGLVIVLGGLNSGLAYIESKVGVTARLVDDLEPAAIDQLVSEVSAIPGVATVEYISPETAMQRLEAEYADRGQTLDTGGADISLYSSIEIALTDPSAARPVAAALGEREEIETITTRQEQYDKLLGVTNIVRLAGLSAMILVGLTVVFMIVNTIRIAVFSRSREIEIMRLVGASDAFIRWPFIVEGMLCGLLGAFVTVLLVALVWSPIQPLLIEIFQMPTAVGAQFYTFVAVLILSVGLVVGTLGSWISVRAHLAAGA
ncbi:MAG TPA: permease-like cell division protein FtsX [Candidatus Limnocylindria bacterium]|jgi:cell division transport system permease protein|nr:permease-like cell division protein FtsX [Candidatus Limnocylindria bacterium]